MTRNLSANALVEKETRYYCGYDSGSCRKEKAKARVSKSHACMIICQVLRVRVRVARAYSPLTRPRHDGGALSGVCARVKCFRLPPGTGNVKSIRVLDDDSR